MYLLRVDVPPSCALDGVEAEVVSILSESLKQQGTQGEVQFRVVRSRGEIALGGQLLVSIVGSAAGQLVLQAMTAAVKHLRRRLDDEVKLTVEEDEANDGETTGASR